VIILPQFSQTRHFQMSSANAHSASDQFNAALLHDRHLQEVAEKRLPLSEDVRVSYRQLGEKVNRFGNAQRGLKVRIEEPFSCSGSTGPSSPLASFGAIKIGAVPVPVNTLLKPADYQYISEPTRGHEWRVVSDRSIRRFRPFPGNSSAT